MISNELENCLTVAFRQAREGGHEHLTVEHLLLAVLDTPKVCEILGACRCDLTKLRQDLSDHLQHSTPRLVDGTESVVQPTPGFQRVLHRAESHATSRREKREMGVSDVWPLSGMPCDPPKDRWPIGGFSCHHFKYLSNQASVCSSASWTFLGSRSA